MLFVEPVALACKMVYKLLRNDCTFSFKHTSIIQSACSTSPDVSPPKAQELDIKSPVLHELTICDAVYIPISLASDYQTYTISHTSYPFF